MTDPKILELRQWSAENLMGWKETEDGSWVDYLGNLVFIPGGFKPDVEKTGHIWMVVRKMREQLSDGSDGFNFNLNWQAHKGITISIAQFHKIDPFVHGQGADDNPCIATLLAANDAWTQWATGSYRRA